jgi:hypothetical protein
LGQTFVSTTRLLEFLDFRVELLERRFHRRDELFDGLLALLQIPTGGLLEFLQSGAGQFEEGLVVPLSASAERALKASESFACASFSSASFSSAALRSLRSSVSSAREPTSTQ